MPKKNIVNVQGSVEVVIGKRKRKKRTRAVDQELGFTRRKRFICFFVEKFALHKCAIHSVLYPLFKYTTIHLGKKG